MATPPKEAPAPISLPSLPQVFQLSAAPYEGAIIKICELAMKAMDGQTAEQKKVMWDIHIKNLENWQSFWEKFGEIFKPKA